MVRSNCDTVDSIYSMDIFERVLFNANSAIYQLQQTTCQSADDEVDLY